MILDVLRQALRGGGGEGEEEGVRRELNPKTAGKPMMPPFSTLSTPGLHP